MPVEDIINDSERGASVLGTTISAVFRYLRDLSTLPLSIPGAADTYKYYKEALFTSSTKNRLSANTIITQSGFYFTTYLLFCYLVYVVSTLFRNHLSRSEYFESEAKRVLVVTAHPDDECMFFGPVIVRLVKSKRTVYLLCLSNGNFYNKGHLRKKELYESCEVLGIAKENIFLCCSALRLDGSEFIWKSEMIAILINDYVSALDIDTVVTFDKVGVSGHQNHISVFRAMSYLCLRNWLPITCRVFVLDSLGIVRKYSSLMDCALSLLSSQNVFVLSPSEHRLVKQAMYKHKTQMVWYRRLYLHFSRYTFVNSFYELQRFQG